MIIKIMHSLYQQVYKYSIPKNYTPLTIEFISYMRMISINIYRQTKIKTNFIFVSLEGIIYQAEL